MLREPRPIRMSVCARRGVSYSADRNLIGWLDTHSSLHVLGVFSLPPAPSHPKGFLTQVKLGNEYKSADVDNVDIDSR